MVEPCCHFVVFRLWLKHCIRCWMPGGVTRWVGYGSMGLSKNRWSNIYNIFMIYHDICLYFTLHIDFECPLNSVTKNSRKSWNPNHQTRMILVTFIQDFDWSSKLLLTYSLTSGIAAFLLGRLSHLFLLHSCVRAASITKKVRKDHLSTEHHSKGGNKIQRSAVLLSIRFNKTFRHMAGSESHELLGCDGQAVGAQMTCWILNADSIYSRDVM